MSEANPFLKLFQQQARLKIRLAVLKPGEDGPLKLDTIEGTLGEIAYECVSYNRTADEDTVDVIVNEQPQPVPKHLEAGLRALRRKGQSRTLWADLLVGNSTAERSKEATTTRTILENAERTLCWTGNDNARTAKAFGTLREMANRWTQACTQYDIPEYWSRATRDNMQKVFDRLRSCPYNDLDSFNFDHWNEIYSIFSSPYWKSVQSISEIVLAKKAIILCGRSNLTWEDYKAASMALPIFHGKFFGGVPLLPNVFKTLEVTSTIALADTRRRMGDTIELLPMVQSAREVRPRDPRDCVFSMLPIVTPSGRRKVHSIRPELPEIDHTRSVQEVFVEAARYIIHERQDLCLWMGERQPCTKRIKNLPTWCPDFSRGTNFILVSSKENGLRMWWESLHPVKTMTVSDDNTLHIQVHPLDRITYISPLFHAANFERLTLKIWKHLNSARVVDQAREEMFWRTLILNQYGYGDTLNTTSVPPAELGQSFRTMIAGHEILDVLGFTSKEDLKKAENADAVDLNNPRIKALYDICVAGNAQAFKDLMQSTTFGRRFFVTETGRYGMTAVENYRLLDDQSLRSESEDDEGDRDPNQPRGIGEVMNNPLARDMLAGFQQHLESRDPQAARQVARMMSGELPHDQEDEKTGIREGDVIVACVGGFFPVVLRPKTHATNINGSLSSAFSDAVFEYVGDCYLHGVMEGECFKGRDAYGQEAWVTDRSKLVDVQIV